jgi:hypothetical protein
MVLTMSFFNDLKIFTKITKKIDIWCLLGVFSVSDTNAMLPAWSRAQTAYIEPGSPWENGYCERFNGTLRREVLNAEWFTTTKQAQIVINQWLRQYNHVRPHQALNMRPTAPETLIRNGTELGG